MKAQLRKALETIEQSQESAAFSVGEHLRTVASNGPEYATTEAMHEEARALIAAAQSFLALTGAEPHPANNES